MFLFFSFSLFVSHLPSLPMPFFLWYFCFLSFVFRVSKASINWQSKVCLFHLFKLTFSFQWVFAIVTSLWMRNVSFDHSVLLGMCVCACICVFCNKERISCIKPLRESLFGSEIILAYSLIFLWEIKMWLLESKVRNNYD